MTLQQLRYIVTIVNCGSISEAAKQLFITQPSLSNAVRELEKEMGISIFNRSSKGIALSSQGTEFLSYARQVLEQAELLEQPDPVRNFPHEGPGRMGSPFILVFLPCFGDTVS